MLAALVACTLETPTPDVVARAVRASVAVRGFPPAADEIRALRADPRLLEAQVDAWLADPAFAATVRDLHADTWLLRADVVGHLDLPQRATLEGIPDAVLFPAEFEAPLVLVERIVTEDRPYAEIVMADRTWSNAVLAAVYGLPFDPGGPTWQAVAWPDGRPAAGLLAENAVWRRHPSPGDNHHRARAAFVLSALLCEDLSTADLPADIAHAVDAAGAVDGADCAACHAVLDPLAAYFVPFSPLVTTLSTRRAAGLGCGTRDDGQWASYGYADAVEDHCLPLGLWHPERVDPALPPPAFGSLSGGDLADLGRTLAADPAFARCAVRRFWSGLARVPLDEVPDDVTEDLLATFHATGGRTKAVVRAAVLDERFAALPSRPVGPEAYARRIEHLTGFRWLAAPDAPGCAERHHCVGTVDLLTTDDYGLRALAGGVDGYTVATPAREVGPTQVLVAAALAEEAAAFVVRADRAVAPAERRLLHRLTGDDDEATVRAQLADLRLTVLGQEVHPADPIVDDDLALLAGGPDDETAWIRVLAALLRDPLAVTF